MYNSDEEFKGLKSATEVECERIKSSEEEKSLGDKERSQGHCSHKPKEQPKHTL